MSSENGWVWLAWQYQVRMARSGEKCDGLAMVASGKGNVNLAL